jgi:hypothetical protein
MGYGYGYGYGLLVYLPANLGQVLAQLRPRLFLLPSASINDMYQSGSLK